MGIANKIKANIFIWSIFDIMSNWPIGYNIFLIINTMLINHIYFKPKNIYSKSVKLNVSYKSIFSS